MTITAGCPPHHWVIAEAVSAVSKGVCMKCGKTQEFRNSTDAATGHWRHLSDLAYLVKADHNG